MEQNLALALLPPNQMIDVINARSALDDARDRNRLRYMQLQELNNQQQGKQNLMSVLSQNPFPQQAPPGPPPQQMPQGQSMGQGVPRGTMPGQPLVPQQQVQGQNMEAARKQFELQKKFTNAKKTYDSILGTVTPDNYGALSSYIAQVKQDPDLGPLIPKDLEVVLDKDGEEKTTFTQTVKEGQYKDPGGNSLPAGRFQLQFKGKKLISAIPADDTGKTETDEQLIKKSLKEKLKRDPTATEILAEKQRLGVEVAGAKAAAGGADARSQAVEIGDAIMRGEQSPVISGFGMAKIAGPLKAYLAKQGYNLRQAELDFHATQKHLNTLNGAQQLRLRQAVTFASDSLGIVEELAGKWQAGRFPPLNKARLIAAKNGAFGPQAQAIATQLETQISDLTSELGTVYKGGNSSTDESLKLAAKNLSENWSYDQLMNNVKLVRRNLDIRSNSIKSTGAAGLSPEAPPAPGAGAPAVGTVEGGYKFKGGDPGKKENWEKV